MKGNGIKIIIVIGIVGMLSGGLLSYVHQKVKPSIEKAKAEKLKEAVLSVVPESFTFVEEVLQDGVIYEVRDGSGVIKGWAFSGRGTGFQGDISLLIGCDSEISSIYDIMVLESLETPGLGSRISEAEFIGQFRNMKLIEEVVCVKNRVPEKSNEVHCISGATISSKAFVKIVNDSIRKLKALKSGSRG